MKNIISHCKFLLSFVIIPAISINAIAQHVPKIQSSSILAPQKVNIDGKTTEWGKFQAYNKVTELFYTTANDDENLYLIIQTAHAEIIRKIALGGITFMVNPTGSKKGKNAISVTFPAYEKKEHPFFISLNDISQFTKVTERNKLQRDSFVTVLNKQLNEKFKTIKVTNSEAGDSLISIYNEDAIKAAAIIDNQLNYTYELAIPLKYLNGGSPASKFYYKVTLNGVTADGSNVHEVPERNILTYTGANGVNYILGASTPENMSYLFATYFSGEYTLAKK